MKVIWIGWSEFMEVMGSRVWGMFWVEWVLKWRVLEYIKVMDIRGGYGIEIRCFKFL